MSEVKIKNTNNTDTIEQFDLFVAVLAVISIINIFLYYFIATTSIRYVIVSIDKLLSFIFLVDFFRLLAKADSKSGYFFKGKGWADLLASLPFPQLKLLRLFRVGKAYRMTKRVGLKTVLRRFFKNRANGALYLISFLILLLLEFASIAILAAEGSNPEANIKTASDAIWWVYVTITTVGYGDRFPVTNTGREIGMLVMLAGVGLFGVLTGFLANKFLTPDSPREVETELQKLHAITQEVAALRHEIASLKTIEK
jgi:voltage-gated potassium channel